MSWVQTASIRALFVMVVASAWMPETSAQVTNYRLFKEAYYSQPEPELVTLDFWAMDANFQASADYAQLITFTPPAPGQPLSDVVADGFWEIFHEYPTQEALGAAYPDGEYRYSVSGGAGGEETGSIIMPAQFFPTDIPQFTPETFTGISGVHPDMPFVAHWNLFSPDPRATNARVRFFLHDHTVEDFPITAGTLPATTTSYEIPTGTLKAGHEYDLLLIFSNAISTPDAGFGTGRSLADANRSTTLRFTAVPEPGSAEHCALGIVLVTLYRRRAQKAEGSSH